MIRVTDKDNNPNMPAPVAEPSRKIFFKASLTQPEVQPTTITDMLERIKHVYNKQVHHIEREASTGLLAPEQQKVLQALTSSLIDLAKEERAALKDSNLSNMTTEELERLVSKGTK